MLDVQEEASGEVWHFTEKPLAAGTGDRGDDRLDAAVGPHAATLRPAPAVGCFRNRTRRDDGLFSSWRGKFDHRPGDGRGDSRVAGTMEKKVNELIAEDRKISASTVSRDEAEALLAEGRLRKLPERVGGMRLIEIEDYDLNACGGTHLHSTGQIGGMLLRSLEKVRQGVRVEFVCGQRAVAALAAIGQCW